ncbi:DUF2079 domain-containing protein [Synechococcus sp. CS-1325]|uniref:DUF2079 domain-containing protein n=1 Tax=Synechococcus sp. CS-1325 TaxID=2847979 RepID=UPI000DAFF83D|nr:DUF2079 domain-containing protein [Synechococcus sp. CS-1325]MCT0199973.1 DUF2079 domain-containing protein [Synechococcus sp. CS-1325]PZU96845.1 MAG: hypothetical protein DCF24_13450 [Cyanobium sp.]
MNHSADRRSWSGVVLAAAVVFAIVGLVLQWWRLQVLTASYDQGIFLQVLWNSLRGHPFESTLSSQLSASVVHDGLLPALGYHRLGQHFTPALLLWAPLVGLLGAGALPLVQVGLMTAAGLVLHRFALQTLGSNNDRLAALLTCSFFAANAVIGPTWGNFTDLCQLPLAFFLLVWGWQRRSWWLVALCTVLIPLIREDTGVLLAGVSLWILVRRKQQWPAALLIGGVGISWVVIVTTVLMPLFSDDNSRRFMVENFGHFIGDQDRASSLDVAGKILSTPIGLIRELVNEPGDTLRYLFAQGLPLLFIPLISLDSWLLMGLPFLGLLLADGKPPPLAINVRYALLVVPGLFAGAVLWWQQHQGSFQRPRLRAVWIGAIGLSILLTISSNPNRALSFLIPDSVSPWIYTNPAQLWKHGQTARRVLQQIPPTASVAASTPLVPLLAEREVLVRFPRSWRYADRAGAPREVEWIAADLAMLSRNLSVSDGDRREIARIIELIPELSPGYGVVDVEGGVVLLARGMADRADAQERLAELVKTFELEPKDER